MPAAKLQQSPELALQPGVKFCALAEPCLCRLFKSIIIVVTFNITTTYLHIRFLRLYLSYLTICLSVYVSICSFAAVARHGLPLILHGLECHLDSAGQHMAAWTSACITCTDLKLLRLELVVKCNPKSPCSLLVGTSN